MKAFFQLSGQLIRKLRSGSRRGQTLVEYALILAIITVVALAVFAEMGRHLVIIFSSINDILDTAQSSH